VVLLAHLLQALRGLSPEEAVATLIQPASMRDEAGLEELFEQTRQIVAMTGRTATPVFGAQLSFNLLPTPLPADPIAAQLRAAIDGLPAVALQILQGGIFHSVSASLWVRCAGDPGVQAVRKALSGHPHLEVADKPRHLGPIDAAASDKILFGNVRRDEAGGGVWLWAVMDNLTRGGALNAIEIAEAVA
jgi:aspartate-semialdehyde dehydrogenase